MVEPQSVVIYLKIQPSADVLPSASDDVFPAGIVNVAGTVTRVCCDGRIGDTDPFHQSFNFVPGRDGFQPSELYLQQPFRFTFRNEQDYLLLNVSFSIRDTEGHEKVSTVLTRMFYFRNVTYDVISGRYYINYQIATPLVWEVADPV